MTAVLYQVSASLGTPSLSRLLPTDGWTVTEQAEEGSVGESTLTLYDSDGTLATAFRQLQNLAIVDTSTGGDVLVWGGYSADWTWSRGDTANSRTLQVTLNDANWAWSRLVLTGTASSRPAETDVARVQWAMTTYAADVAFGDVTTYVSTASPVAMDAADYRGQYLSDLVGDCSQASGKNWWASQMGTSLASASVTAWYGDSNASTAYAGTCAVTNDPALIDSSAYWAPTQDASIVVDPSRIFSGVYVEFDGGAAYRYKASTGSAYLKRDTVISAMNVKTVTKARARGDRYLSSWNSPHERVTCSVRVPATKVSQFRAGMRVQAGFTHIPGWESPRWCRVLRRTVSQRAAGTLYDVELEMTPVANMTALHYFGCPYVNGDTAPGSNGTHSYYVGDTPHARRGNVFLLGTVSSNASDYEAFTGSSRDVACTDGFCSGISPTWSGARGPSGFYFQIDTVSITSESPLVTVSAPVSADTIVIWKASGALDIVVAGIALTVDGVSIGSFSPTWSQGWNSATTPNPLTAGTTVTYLASSAEFAGGDNGTLYGARFDLGALVTGTSWRIAITTAGSFPGGSSILRVTEIQAFNLTY